MGMRWCVRCSGILAGILIFFLSNEMVALNGTFGFIISFVCPVPAVVDFSLNEINKWNGNNGRRVLTGAFLGISIGMMIYEFTLNSILSGCIILSWIIFLEVLVILILKKYKVLERFIQEYENGVFKVE